MIGCPDRKSIGYPLLHAGPAVIGICSKCGRRVFCKLTRRRLQRGVFSSLVDLPAAINRYLAEHNHSPRLFIWTVDPDRTMPLLRAYPNAALDETSRPVSIGLKGGLRNAIKDKI